MAIESVLEGINFFYVKIVIFAPYFLRYGKQNLLK